MGSGDGVVVIALASHLRGPGSGHEWVKFTLLREVFLRFSPLLKNQYFQIPVRSDASLSQPSFGGALRDIPKDGCEGD